MNTNFLISVIIPVYNVEKYLERCLSSILAQSYENLEIILVDDGSTDNSGAICDEYGKKDARITVFHKINGGQSSARNIALDYAHGDWITFVDSDDWVDKDYVKHMLEKAISTKSQIAVIASVNTVNENVYVKKETQSFLVLDNEHAMANLLYQKYYSFSACCKLYKKELFSNIRFPEGKVYEEMEPIYRAFARADQIVVSDEILYFYFQRQGSTVRRKFSITEKMNYVENTKIVLEDVKRNYPKLVNAAISRLLWADIHVLVHMDEIQKYEKEFKLLWEDIRKNRKRVLRDKNVRLINRIVLIISFLGTNALKIVFKIQKIVIPKILKTSNI